MVDVYTTYVSIEDWMYISGAERQITIDYICAQTVLLINPEVPSRKTRWKKFQNYTTADLSIFRKNKKQVFIQTSKGKPKIKPMENSRSH